MFNLFKKKKVAKDLAEYLDSHEKERAKYLAAMKPLRDEETKARFVIKQIYAQHGIDAGDWFIYKYCLDNEVFTDLHVFSEDELASLRKWTQRYKESTTEIDKLVADYSDRL